MSVHLFECTCQVESIDGVSTWVSRCEVHTENPEAYFKDDRKCNSLSEALSTIALSSNGISSVKDKSMTEHNSKEKTLINSGLANTRRHVQRVTKIGKNGQKPLDMFIQEKSNV